MGLVLLTGSLTGCTGKETPVSSDSTVTTATNTSTSESTEIGKEGMSTSLAAIVRPRLVAGTDGSESLPSYTVNVANYSVNDDFSNVLFTEQLAYQSEEMKQKLKDNLFVISGDAGMEFFQLYEFNRYGQKPSFVTVDSLMHTYHLYFMKLLKTTEKDYLSGLIKTMTDKLYDKSLADYESFKGTDWESAALRNVEFFAVGKTLLDDAMPNVPAAAESTVSAEISKIMAAEQILPCEINEENEDYTQYKVRGYYEGDETLEKYFKAMMWYGRITFPTDKEDTQKSALLISRALGLVGASEWSAVYSVTSFFAGNSDDNGVAEYLPCAIKAYDGLLEDGDLISNKDGFDKYMAAVKELPAPSINSIPVLVTEDNVVQGFRLMGQRFTIDAYIMQNLIYRAVEANDLGGARMLPDVLDVPAAFGSDTALETALKAGAEVFPGYSRNMTKLRAMVEEIEPEFWNANIYSGWINALVPLFSVKGEGYPSFMQSREWLKKDLECFAGSFTELKHDTVLYSKPVMAEMGGGWEEEIDFRGYVEPEPELYAKMSTLTKNMSDGLKNMNLLNADDEANLSKLAETCDILLDISVRELKGESLTDEEYEFIETYGGTLEHFWYDAFSDGTSNYIDIGEHPASLVVDIATDPNGSVLELADGEPSVIYVVVPVEGTLRIARGVVYNFYQFTVPLNARMTDDEWGVMIGTIPTEGEDGYPMYHKSEDIPDKPDWTMSYRAK